MNGKLKRIFLAALVICMLVSIVPLNAISIDDSTTTVANDDTENIKDFEISENNESETSESIKSDDSILFNTYTTPRASGYNPVTNVTINPDGKPSGQTTSGSIRNSGQLITTKIGNTETFVLGAATYTIVGSVCKHTIAIYNPSDYCDISLIDNSGQNLIGNPTYVAANYDKARVFETNFEALKPGKSNDIRVCYYCNFGVIFTNPNLTSAMVACPVCGVSSRLYKDIKWYRYNDVFSVIVNADYQIKYDTNGGTEITSTETTVADTSAKLSITNQIPTKPDYVFDYWEDEDGNIYIPIVDSNGDLIKWVDKNYDDINGDITLNWTEGFGSTANPVSKTLHAVWILIEGNDPDTDSGINPVVNLYFKKYIEGNDENFKKLEFGKNETYNFFITLTNQETGEVINGLLDSKEGFRVNNIPIGTYIIEEQNEIWFQFISMSLMNSIEGIYFKKENGVYIITIGETVESGATVNIEVTNKTDEERLYDAKYDIKNIFNEK